MALIEKATLLARLSPPLDALLTEQFLSEFTSLERRFVLRDWEPAELDGGQFAEALARVLYHVDSGTLNLTKGFDECIKWIEDPSNASIQKIKPHQSLLHLTQVLRTVYKFRSQRGAVHISATYSANQLDARLMIECVRWLTAEIIRLFAKVSPEVAASTIREILDFDVPCIGRFQDIVLVQRTDLTPEEEVLVLLHYAGDEGFSRTILGQYARCSAASVTRSVQKLESPDVRQIVRLSSGNYRLTDLGAKRIRDEMAEKLLLG
jgi:hypothetical protein